MKKEIARLRVVLQGAVQGVGFRPFIYRLAADLNLNGWVCNTAQGLVIEVEGPVSTLKTFLLRIPREKPANSFIQSSQYLFLDSCGFTSFEIKESGLAEEKTTLVLPDIATCPECLNEVFDQRNRRYLYPFTNCTHCGPRYSIIEALPYDRVNTSMKIFEMCDECQCEYEDPSDRRFHAQPNACPECGPELALWNNKGAVLATKQSALNACVAAVQNGSVVAVKGLGGFHLMVDAGNEESVQTLRRKKNREEKPFAVMFPSIDLIENCCEVSETERQLLMSPEAPIVLLPKKENDMVSLAVAPGNPYLGVMLPYTPLHHILMNNFQKPLVATSGNISEEPICIDEHEALNRLGTMADVFLVHNRPIVRHVDDSIVRTIADRPMVLRRARGYAPLPVSVKSEESSVLAVGGHLKNSIALKVKNNIFISQHIGDLQTDQSLRAFKESIASLKDLYQSEVQSCASDMHPEYLSTNFAQKEDVPTIEVQHHHAHIVACMAENQLEGDVLGIAWDGTGYGPDGTVWGGEFLSSNLKSFRRVGHFKTFHLPGGDQAIKEPRRSALGILWEIYQDEIKDMKTFPAIESFSSEELGVLIKMMSRKANSPRTSSVGRLFDAVASLMGVSQKICFEGQAAMALEFLTQGAQIKEAYPVDVRQEECLIVDWTGMVTSILEDVQNQVAKEVVATKFHNTLIEMAVEVAKRVNCKRVVLSGGCFQNAYLSEGLIRRLQSEGFDPYWHQLVPPNDGGIALGQAVSAACRLEENPCKFSCKE